tara:strand:- start:1589 stop:2752 length:1164 start_codon:yes stop_codon:yes gene_type:complete
MAPIHFVFASALILAGCTTLGTNPVPIVSNPAAICPSSGSAPALLSDNTRPLGSPQLTLLCAELISMRNSANAYRAGVSQLERSNSIFRTTAFTSTIAGVGFEVFDAHPDNALAAGLLAGTAGILNNGLNLQQRANVYRRAVLAYDCLIDNGAIIGSALRKDMGLGATTAPLVQLSRYDELVRLYGAFTEELARASGLVSELEAKERSLVRDLEDARLSHQQAQGAAALAAASADLASSDVALQAHRAASADLPALRANITRASTMRDDVLQAITAINQYFAHLTTAQRQMEVLIGDRLAGMQPDIGALVREAQALGTQSQQAAVLPETAGGTDDSVAEVRELSLEMRLQGHIRQLDAYISMGRQLTPTLYTETASNLVQCKALVAA